MAYNFSPYSIAQFLTGAVSIIVAVHLWQRRVSRGGWLLFLLFIAVSEMALANGLEAAAVPVALKVFWSKISYLGAQASPVLLVLFALQYTGKGRRISPPFIAALFIIPLAAIILAATNENHSLIWKDFLPGPAGTNSLIYVHGTGYWIIMAYIFLMVLVGSLTLIVSAVPSQQMYRKQNVLMLGASIMPWAGFLMYVLNLNPFPGLDTVSISFLFTGLLLVWGMYKNGFLDFVPIAHELIIENVDEGVLVIDPHLRVIDLNPAAANLLNLIQEKTIGVQLETIGEFWKKFQSQLDRETSNQYEFFPDKMNAKHLDVRGSPLYDHRKKFLGWAIILNDISILKNVEDALSRVNIQLKEQLEEIQALHKQLREQAIRDSLTGVYNRRYLDETLPRELAHAARGKYPLSIIMLDIDNFKLVNDTFGHQVGDEVIVALGRLLQSQTRIGDCVSRYGGGDEFVLVLPEMSKEDAHKRAELWREAVKAMLFQVDETVLQLTISLGVATYPENGRTAETLMKSADDALYQAKESGRDRTCIAK